MAVRSLPSVFDDLAAPWDALVPRAARLGPFPTPAWCRLWWRHLGSVDGAAPRIEVVRRGDALVAVVPLYVEADGQGPSRVLFFGGRDVTDYTGPAASQDGLAAAADAAVGVVEEDGLVLECLSTPDDLGFADALVASASSRGLAVSRDPTEPAPFLELPSDMDGYLDSLDGKDRHELRRKLRRFEREVGPPRLRRAGADTVADDLELFFGWHRRAPGEKGTFMTPRREAFFRAIADEYLPRGRLALDVLEGGGGPVAASFSFLVDDTVYLYNSSFEPTAYRWSPGVVLLAALIERSISDGLSRLDFLKGEERYKFQLGAVRRSLSSVRVGPKGSPTGAARSGDA